MKQFHLHLPIGVELITLYLLLLSMHSCTQNRNKFILEWLAALIVSISTFITQADSRNCWCWCTPGICWTELNRDRYRVSGRYEQKREEGGDGEWAYICINNIITQFVFCCANTIAIIPLFVEFLWKLKNVCTFYLIVGGNDARIQILSAVIEILIDDHPFIGGICCKILSTISL